MKRFSVVLAFYVAFASIFVVRAVTASSYGSGSGGGGATLPQPLGTGDSPTFADETLTGKLNLPGAKVAGAGSGIMQVANSTLASSAAFRVFNLTDSATSPTNAEWLEVAWSANLCTIQTAKSGTGSMRALSLYNLSTLDGGNQGFLTIATGGTGIAGFDLVNGGINASHYPIRFGSGLATGSADAGFSRHGPGVIAVGNGDPDDHSGKLQMNGTTASGTVAPTWTNFPGVNTGTQNPYTWITFVAPDGTTVYVPAFK